MMVNLVKTNILEICSQIGEEFGSIVTDLINIYENLLAKQDKN